jgi:hypothetical protein
LLQALAHLVQNHQLVGLSLVLSKELGKSLLLVGLFGLWQISEKSMGDVVLLCGMVYVASPQ